MVNMTPNNKNLGLLLEAGLLNESESIDGII